MRNSSIGAQRKRFISYLLEQREEVDIDVDDLKIEKKQSVHYLCKDKYVLTYAAV